MYHDALIGRGIEGFTWEQCWREYRRMTFHGVIMAVAASMLVERTPRGDDMFMTLFARHAQQALDLDAVELLPARRVRPAAGTASRRRPTSDLTRRRPSSCGTRAGTSMRSTTSGRLGVYVRIGSYPNLGVSWYTAYVCGADRPIGRAWSTSQAPLPSDDGRLAVVTARLRAEHLCEVAARALRRHAGRQRRRPCRRRRAPLRGERGRARRCRARARLGDRRDAVRLSARHALRDPLPSHRDDPRRRGEHGAARHRAARPLVGHARLVGDGLGLERRRARRRHAPARRAATAPEPADDRDRLRPVGRGGGIRARPRRRHRDGVTRTD